VLYSARKLKVCGLHLLRGRRGSSTVELAIVFPILLLLFVGAAELGRMFYTYTTLAKATKAGARYLSNSKEFMSSDPDIRDPAIERAQSLVVCGYESCTGPGRVAIVPGLKISSPANVKVTTFTQTEGTTVIRYVTVEIQNYTYQRGIFTLDGVTGASGATSVYKALAPKTTMRYML
jgi:Flp pilus assembly protein TadG